MKQIFIILFFTINFGLFSQQVSEFSEIPVTPYEQWVINGETFEIAQTVITGGALFTIHAVVDHQPEMDEYNENIAKDIAIYAIENGYLGNALNYNNYNGDQFYIKDGIVGVALIKILNPITREMSGTKFTFEVEDILPDLDVIPEIKPPETFSEEAQEFLLQNIDEIIQTRRFDNLYNLFSVNALDDINEESRTQSRVIFSLVKEYIFDNPDTFTVYIGQKGGISGFHHYIPVTLIPVSDETQRLSAFLQLTIIDEDTVYGLYGVMLNFIDYNSMRILYGSSGSVEFPVIKD